MDISQVSGFSPLAEQIPGGESLNRFRARVQETTNSILEIGSSSKGAALLVTHGFFAITLLGLLGAGEQRLDRCTLYRFWRESSTSPWQFEEAI
jgi:broad specificity phosphatase PhoE